MTPLTSFDWTFGDVAANLACDEALLVQAEERTSLPVLRFWELDHPAVVLGASCRLRDDVRVDACHADAVPIARRSSGGGTVVLGPGALNVTIVLPITSDPVAFRSVDTAQQSILDRVAVALRSAGVDVQMLGSGDLTLGSRKIAGSAQRRLRQFLMVHASILYDFDLGRIDRYLQLPTRQPAYRQNRSHAEFVTNLSLDRPEIVAAVRSIWPTNASDLGVDRELLDLVADLARTKFGDNGWIERL